MSAAHPGQRCSRLRQAMSEGLLSTTVASRRTACASTRRQGQRIGHDWLVDTQPANSSFTTIGMLLGRDSARRMHVGIEMIATRPTFEYALRTAVGASNMPAAATSLRGMPGINPSHRTTPFFGFVPDKALTLGKRPGVHAAPGFGMPSGFHALANARKVFQDDGSARLDGLNDLLGEHMIAVTAEVLLSVAHTLEMPFCAARPFLLQRAREIKQPTFDRLPPLLAQKAIVGCDGGTR